MKRSSAKVTSAPIANAAAGHHHAKRLGRVARAGAAGAMSTRSSARLTSAADCHRSSASFARHRRIMLSMPGGAASCISGSVRGSALMIAEMTLAASSPSNARFPISISYSTAPKAKMSVRASAGLPCNCSGAMYWSVPVMAPSAGIDMVAVSAPSFSVCLTCARPKSSSFTPFFEIKILAGLRSQWMIPWRCAASSASRIWRA